ncbi:EAL domain-containing protein [Leptothermofonsia sichuanensis E412]|uniref:EAL domain-containing response regulator n=1 Tax=Leptothermofonsia sichuanensis TaxID=2917832 RepID=UPI001CA65279|nr:GGDEF domain-containing response regulator [Leptothermofonsia sichuanensis]QZZ22958.1 EAL domain-containing protein [Leptothermofonsia sichuanensis E412]
MTQILVIEDDPNVRTLILKLLQAEGFDALSAEDGRTGLHLAKVHEPDLIICDIMMPEFDGYEVLSQLRQNSATATIPFIFLSAKSERTDLRQGMELGADDYLTKPFKRAELLGAISARLTKQAALTQPYVDEMKRAAQTLNQLAYRDPLTNLPNRILLHHRFQEAIAQASLTSPQQMVAILWINLNRFKAININMGYTNGDLLLKMVAERLERAFGQRSTVARLGSDEFSMLLGNLAEKEEAARVAQKILKVLAEPYDLDGHYAQIQASIGIALYPDHSNSPDRLLNQADTAMRHVKASGSGGYQFYAQEMDILVSERQQMESQLNSALENLEFQLHYQPQVNLITGRVIGAEALIRWHNPQLGMVQPDKFIGIAEDTGLIIPIGEWVLKTACTQAKAWQDSSRLPIRISVNLSARQFRQENLVAKVDQTLKETGLAANLLILELTETSVMENVETTIQTLKDLKEMGVRISIDDFGTGYSSLNYLKRFPIDTLKIDQSFVREVTTDPNDAAIAKAIIAMAQSLQLKVIAEGVETEEQFNFLRQSGCHAMQGYLFSPPIPATEFETLIRSDRRMIPGLKTE